MDDGLDAVLGQRVHVVAEREERVGCAHQAIGGNAHALTCLVGALAGKLGGIDAVRLARAHADARVVLGNQDGVGLNALAHLPGKQHLVQLVFGGLGLGGNGELVLRFGNAVYLLGKHAAVHGAELHSRRGIHAAGGQNAQVLLLLQQLQRIGRERRGNEHFHEQVVLVDVLDEFLGNLHVCGDDPAVGALRVAGEGLVEGFHYGCGSGGTAGVLMLQDNHGGLVELARDGPAGIGIQDVVVRKLLAVELLGVHQGMLGGKLGHAVERGALMRVLAVAKALLLHQVDGKLLGEQLFGLAELAAQPLGNGAVVGVGGLEHTQRKLSARCKRGCAVVGAHLGQDGAVACRVGYHGNAGEVLGGGAQHGRAADVDVLDAGTEVGAGFNRLLEGIEVHHHHVDHLDAVLFGLGHMLRVVALGKKAAVHRRVQRLHAAVHHLGELGNLVDGGNGNAGLCDNASRAARRDYLRTEFLGQRAGELDYAGLVRHRHKNTLYLGVCHLVPPFLFAWFVCSSNIAAPERATVFKNEKSQGRKTLGLEWRSVRARYSAMRTLRVAASTEMRPSASSCTTCGYSSCSTAWMRASRASTVSPSRTSTARWAMMGPLS